MASNREYIAIKKRMDAVEEEFGKDWTKKILSSKIGKHPFSDIYRRALENFIKLTMNLNTPLGPDLVKVTALGKNLLVLRNVEVLSPELKPIKGLTANKELIKGLKRDFGPYLFQCTIIANFKERYERTYLIKESQKAGVKTPDALIEFKGQKIQLEIKTIDVSQIDKELMERIVKYLETKRKSYKILIKSRNLSYATIDSIERFIKSKIDSGKLGRFIDDVGENSVEIIKLDDWDQEKAGWPKFPIIEGFSMIGICKIQPKGKYKGLIAVYLKNMNFKKKVEKTIKKIREAIAQCRYNFPAIVYIQMSISLEDLQNKRFFGEIKRRMKKLSKGQVSKIVICVYPRIINTGEIIAATVFQTIIDNPKGPALPKGFKLLGEKETLLQ